MIGKRLLFTLGAFGVILGVCFPGKAIPQNLGGWKVGSDRAVKGFVHPESAAYDPAAKVLFIGQFGSMLRTSLKDGKGKISRVSLDGKIMEEKFLPAPGTTLHKPRGIWVEGSRLWVADIEGVWIFDLKSRRGKYASLPGAKFPNDLIVMAKSLLVSDHKADQIFRIEPADFLENHQVPKVSPLLSGKSVGPNGLFPGRDGSLWIAGYQAGKKRGIYSLDGAGNFKALSKDLGELDGIAELDDGSFLITDWKTKSLSHWSPQAGMKILASGFKGPADFCVVPENGGKLLVAVPDLVKSELRLIRLAK